MMEKYNDLPVEAQYVVLVAGSLIGILLLVLLIYIIVLVSRNSGGSSDKVKVPKNLPLTPVVMLEDRESALYERLRAVVDRHEKYSLHAKVSSGAIIGAHANEHPKVVRAISKNFIHDVHDFVVLDEDRRAVAIVELDSDPKDKREEQARRAGIPIFRISDPRISTAEIESRFGSIFR